MFSLNHLMGMPMNASQHGYTVDEMLEFCHWFMLALFVGWGIFFTYTLVRFRAGRAPKADYYGVRTKASTHIEFMVIVIDALILIGFAIPIWAKRVTHFPLGDSLIVKVVAQQFQWNFHYAGSDGVFGRQDVSLINGSNQVGLDPKDPHAKDDFVSINEMHVPLNRNVILMITSKDVIHSVSVPSLRLGQDAIPGAEIPVWFKPVKIGTYEIVCGQLCGANHYGMRGTVVVDAQADYDGWVKDEEQNASVGATLMPATSAATPAASPAPAPAVPPTPAPAAAAPAGGQK